MVSLSRRRRGHRPGEADTRSSPWPGSFFVRPNFYWYERTGKGNQQRPLRLPIQRDPKLVLGSGAHTDYPCEYRDTSTWSAEGPWCADCNDPEGDWLMVVAQTYGQVITNERRLLFGHPRGQREQSGLWNMVVVSRSRIDPRDQASLRIYDGTPPPELGPYPLVGFVSDLWTGNTGLRNGIPFQSGPFGP